MRLSSLLSAKGVRAFLKAVAEAGDPEIESLAYDSRQVGAGSLFFAIQGFQSDGHLYLDQALNRGAVAVASERPAPDGSALVWIQVSCIRRFMASVADHFFGNPSGKLSLVGITGTNGKTTTACLVHSVMSQGEPALVMGTLGARLGGRTWPSERTTPESIDIQAILHQAVEAGCGRGVLEVSSHSLALNRVYGCRFPVAVFTNLTQDHLDFHRNRENYLQSKRLLFQSDYNPGLAWSVVNHDDRASRRLQPEGETVTFGMAPEAQVRPLTRRTTVGGTRVELECRGRRLSLHSPLVGDHNLYNIMAAVAACHALGVPDRQICRGISSVDRVPGRFETVDVDRDYMVVVDYAHTPDALENVLRLARGLTSNRVLCVFGCGGDRDAQKRPRMGEIATRQSDWTILTTDNPRNEDPEDILQQIRAGVPPGRDNFETITDRQEAIDRVVKLARTGDLVLVAGKGQETYQEIRGVRIPFDDREAVRNSVCLD